MSRRRSASHSPVPQCLVVTHDDERGFGHAELDGRHVYVKGALAGEVVSAQLLGRGRGASLAKVLEVIEAVPFRVAPFCDHFHDCGGCSLQHLSASQQIERKQRQYLAQLTAADWCADQVAPPIQGPQTHYRRKARLSARFTHRHERLFLGFREWAGGQVADIDSCAVLAPPFASSIALIRELLRQLTVRDALPQVEVAVGDDVAVMVVRHLQSLTQADLRVLRALQDQVGVTVALQPAGPQSLHLLDDSRSLALHYGYPDPLGALEFEFLPLDFIQVNKVVNERMLERAMSWLDMSGQESVLDLFCGIGNFSLVLARRAARVLGVEGEADLVARARRNAERNGVRNASFRVMDLHTPAAADLGRAGDVDVVLLDPPRSGAGAAAMQAIAEMRPHRVLYVSCNPATFVTDAAVLKNSGYTFAKTCLLDMFPNTAHVECMSLFMRQ